MKSFRIPCPEQDPEKRVENFEEVSLGYSEEEAQKEAKRCTSCKDHKCMQGCPLGIDIPKFIGHIHEGKTNLALKTILKDNQFPEICGRLCPQERLCESLCIKDEPIAIGKLERFAADNGYLEASEPGNIKDKKKIAIIGSGPAGLACAAELGQTGHKVTLYEALSQAGGMLLHGFPRYKLPLDILDKQILRLKEHGIEIRTNAHVGKSISLDEVRKKYDAVYLGLGSNSPRFLEIPNEDLDGVMTAQELLTRINKEEIPDEEFHGKLKKGKKVVIAGGGNIALDAARTARRLGADVTVIYPRALDDMPARKEDIKHAQDEGIHFMMLTQAIGIKGESHVTGIECQQMMLGPEDELGRRKLRAFEDTEFVIDADQVIIAVGKSPDTLITRAHKFEHDLSGYLEVEENYMTSIPGVFAGGDITGGIEGVDATIINALTDGKKAAQAIDIWVKQEKLKAEE